MIETPSAERSLPDIVDSLERYTIEEAMQWMFKKLPDYKHIWEMMIRLNPKFESYGKGEICSLLKHYGPVTTQYLLTSHGKPHSDVLWQLSLQHQTAIKRVIQKRMVRQKATKIANDCTNQVRSSKPPK
jgi:hypothetical protein